MNDPQIHFVRGHSNSLRWLTILIAALMVSTAVTFWYAAEKEWIYTRWNYDDSEYHYITGEIWKLDLEIEAYEAQLIDSEEFIHRMIEFYQQHKENLLPCEPGESKCQDTS